LDFISFVTEQLTYPLMVRTLQYFTSIIVSVVLSSYLLIFSLAFSTNNFIQKSGNGSFKENIQISLKKRCKEISCGYLKYVAPSNIDEKLLKGATWILPKHIFLLKLADIVHYTIFIHQPIVYSPPNKPVLNCSLLI
jgi:hypothetical protein